MQGEFNAMINNAVKARASGDDGAHQTQMNQIQLAVDKLFK